jgi:hypothetical protein
MEWAVRAPRKFVNAIASGGIIDARQKRQAGSQKSAKPVTAGIA